MTFLYLLCSENQPHFSKVDYSISRILNLGIVIFFSLSFIKTHNTKLLGFLFSFLNVLS